MILLDTNVVSELDNRRIDRNVAKWVSVQNPLSLFICDPVIMELSYGAERAIRKFNNFRYKSSLDDLVANVFEHRVLPFNTEDALTAGRLRSIREAIGHPVASPDMMIAAIALNNNMTLATRNTKDFDSLDLKLVNPFEAD